MTGIPIDHRTASRLLHLRRQVAVFPDGEKRPHVEWTDYQGVDQVIPLAHAAWSIYHGQDVPPEHIVVPKDGDEYHIQDANLEILAPVKPYVKDGVHWVKLPGPNGETSEMRHDRLVIAQQTGHLPPEDATVVHKDGDSLNDEPGNLVVQLYDGTALNPKGAP